MLYFNEMVEINQDIRDDLTSITARKDFYIFFILQYQWTALPMPNLPAACSAMPPLTPKFLIMLNYKCKT